MYKVIENGTEKMCSAEETEAMIKDFNKRNHIFPSTKCGGHKK